MTGLTEEQYAERAAYIREWSAKNREATLITHRKANAKWQRANRHKHRAHESVRIAVKSGRLVRPESCQQCNKTCKPEASHDDYERRLDVEWLCRQCHARKDRRQR